MERIVDSVERIVRTLLEVASALGICLAAFCFFYFVLLKLAVVP